MKALLVGVLCAVAATADAAVITGRVTHPTKPAAAAGIRVEALGLDANEQSIVREVKTDADGRFRFENLPAPAAYLVRVTYDGLSFAGGSAIFRPGEPEATPNLDVVLRERSSDASALTLRDLQWVIERSAGVWRVHATVTVANSSASVVLIPDAAPTPIRMSLAPGHGELETAFGRLPDGVRIVDDVAEIRGPVFPGDEGFRLELAYDLLGAGAELATEIATPSAVETLRVYIQDFGIAVSAGALHPARPARQDDLIYQSFLGFALPEGARLPLAVQPLPPGTTLPRGVVAGLTALAAGALLAFVLAPVLRAKSGLTASEPRDDPAQELRSRLEGSLADLEHDFETGKLSAEERERMRDELHREATLALARVRGRVGPRPSPAKSAAEPACACGRIPAAADRFCSACGRAV